METGYVASLPLTGPPLVQISAPILRGWKPTKMNPKAIALRNGADLGPDIEGMETWQQPHPVCFPLAYVQISAPILRGWKLPCLLHHLPCLSSSADLGPDIEGMETFALLRLPVGAKNGADLGPDIEGMETNPPQGSHRHLLRLKCRSRPRY